MDYHTLLVCDKDTGELRWKDRGLCSGLRSNKAKAGRLAGSVYLEKDGTYPRYRVCIFGKHHAAHRIIWEMHHGPIPKGMVIDHKDGNSGNNKLDNLRLATSGQNRANSKCRKTRTGLKGVTRADYNKWHAQIRYQGKIRYLGSYITKGLAAVAYAKAALRYHGKFARFC
jgi:hypothetical protein